jgi:hypothetical protein
MKMGGPNTCWARRRAKVLLSAAGALVICLGNLDCQAGIIISQAQRSLSNQPFAVEVDSTARAGMYDVIAGQAESGPSSPRLPLSSERSARLKAPMKALLGECGGASSPTPGTSGQVFSSFASHASNELFFRPAAAIYAHWREISPSLAAGERMEQLDPPRL